MGCYGVTIETFKALVATQLRHIVVQNPGIARSVLMQVFLTEWLVNFLLVDNGRFSWRLKDINQFCISPSVFLKTKSYLLVFVGDEQPGKKGTFR